MMTAAVLSSGKAENYFQKEKDYYTEHQSNYDRWHGSLAETRGFTGEVSKEQFDAYLDFLAKQGRPKRAGIDCTFSAPKPVSLMMAASPEDREIIIRAHQRAVERMIPIFEQEFIFTRSGKGKSNMLTHNMSSAEFLHFLARPTKENGFIAELDLHSHLFILNDTYWDGKSMHINAQKILLKQKELGLTYRGFLAEELGKHYELEVDDARQGSFTIKGITREIVEENSHRRAAILKTAAEHGMSDLTAANLYSRELKKTGKASLEEILQQKQEELFASGRVRFERKQPQQTKGDIENGKHDNDGTDSDSGQFSEFEALPRKRNAFNLAEGESPIFEGTQVFEASSSLRDMPRGDVVPEHRHLDSVLPADAVTRLAKLQSEEVRNFYLQRQAEAERLKQIDDVARETIRSLEQEKFAFSVYEARERVRAAGVLMAITRDEATKALERAQLVELGPLHDADGKATPDRYITTQANLEEEQRIMSRVAEGKGKIQAHILTTEESRERLLKMETAAKERGETSFLISDASGPDKGEQAEAVHHILSCQDRFVCVDGLAGTGKTTSMERLKWMCDAEGITIKGACFSGKAAGGLEDDSGIKSQTLHSFLGQLERESGIKRPPLKEGEIQQRWDFSRVQHIAPGEREIWTVDEAGLVGNHLMEELQRAAEARGAQVLLLGDPDQLPPVDGGQPLRGMEEAGMATARLTYIRRQKMKELLHAVKESVDGSTIKTFAILKDLGNFHEIADTTQRREAVANEMTSVALKDYKSSLLLVSTNADRKKYNKLIRQKFIEKGELQQGRSYTITTRDAAGNPKHESRDFAANDRIIFRQNNKKLGVKNGQMATILSEDGKTITAKMDNGEIVKIDMARYNAIDYSYAVTDYVSQGMTVDKVVSDMSTKVSPSTRNRLYVTISRARQKAILFTDDESKLEHQTLKWAKKITSRDFAKKMEMLEKQGGITNNDRYHAPAEDAAAKIDKILNSIQIHTLQTEPPDRVRILAEAKEEERRKQRAAEAAKKEAEEIREWEEDPLGYVARRAPDEVALRIETADTITPQEREEVRSLLHDQHADTLLKDTLLARDRTGELHFLPFSRKGSGWKAGKKITYGQLHKSIKAANRLQQTKTGKTRTAAVAQYAALASAGRGAARGAVKAGIGGAQNVAGKAKDVLSIFDPNTKGKDKMKDGMKQVAKAAVRTPAKIIANIIANPITGILKAPFEILNGAWEMAVGAMKIGVGAAQRVANEEDLEEDRQKQHERSRSRGFSMGF